MSKLFKSGQILGRSEMKKIMAGTNCQICDDGEMNYMEFDGSEPDDGCSWGLCPEPDEK